MAARHVVIALFFFSWKSGPAARPRAATRSQFARRCAIHAVPASSHGSTWSDAKHGRSANQAWHLAVQGHVNAGTSVDASARINGSP